MADTLDPQDIQKLTTSLESLKNSFDGFSNKNTSVGDSSVKSATQISTTFDKSTAKIVNALGLLAAQLTASARTTAQKQTYMDDFGKSVEKATKSNERSHQASDKIIFAKERSALAEEQWNKRRIDREQKATAAANSAAAAAETLRLANRTTFQKFSDSTSEWIKKSAKDFILGNSYRERDLTENQKLTKNSIGMINDVAKGITNFSSKVANNGDSFNVLNDVIDLTTKLFSGLAGLFGPIGGAIGKLGEAAGAVAKMMVEQFTVGMKAYKELSNVGLATSFENMRATADKTGLLFQDINKALGKNTQGLANYGGTVSRGTKAFSEISNSLKDVRSEFRSLGIDTADFAEFQSHYMAQETMQGRARNKDLAAGTKDYILQLDKLTQLTGESRQGIQEQIDKSRSETKFAASLDNMSEKAAQTFEQVNILLEKKGAAGTAQGFRDLASGSAGTEAAQQLITQSGGKAIQIVEDMRNGTIGMAEAFNQLKGSLKDTQSWRSELAQHSGDNIATKDYAANKKLANSADITADALKEIETEQQKNLKGLNTQTKALTDAGQKLYDASREIQSMATSSENATKMIDLMATSVKDAADVLNKIMGKSTTPESPPISVSGAQGAAAVAKQTGQSLESVTPAQAESQAGRMTMEQGMIAKMLREGKKADPNSQKGKQYAQYIKEHPEALTQSSQAAGGHLSGVSISTLTEDMQKKLIAASNDYYAVTGKNLEINSAGRSSAKQKAMWDKSVSEGREGRTAEGRPIAKPGTSKHELGLAVDIQNYNDPTAIESMRKNGLFQRVEGDDVHFEQARTGGIFRGPSTGYNVELHGDEMVVPANDGVSKQALNSSVFNQDSSAIDGMMSMFERMTEKYDQMIDLLATGNDHREKLVQATV